ncbi:MAG: hypothetical protein ACRCX2_03640 [Paraclostridium sp.]
MKDIEEIIEFLEKNKAGMISGELGLMFKFLETEYIAEFVEETEQYIFQKKCSSENSFVILFFILERSSSFDGLLEKIKMYLEREITKLKSL